MENMENRMKLALTEDQKERVYKAKAKEMFDRLFNYLNLNDQEGGGSLEDTFSHNPKNFKYPKHLVLVLEDMDNPDFLRWTLKKSENLIKEHKELDNPGVLVASFKGGELVDTRIIGIEEALSMIP